MPKRELSCFLCRELLYEYASGQLDARRLVSVKEHLASCDDCPKELKTIEQGQAYASGLSQTEITRDLSENIATETSIVEQFFVQMRSQRLTTSLKWAAEALVVAGVAAASFNYLSQKFFLPDGEREAEEKALIANNERGASAEVDAGQTEEGAPLEPPPGTQEPMEGEEVDVEGVPTGVAVEKAATPVVVAAAETPFVPPARPLVLAPNPPLKPVSTPIPVAAATHVPASTPIPKGFVYRAVLYTEYLDQVAPEVVTKVEALGGKKAGKVPLGWRKDKESYYHFTLPESQQEALMGFLKGYAAVKVDKEPHPRVMPPGTIRYILRVVSAEAAGLPETESPEASDPAASGEQ